MIKMKSYFISYRGKTGGLMHSLVHAVSEANARDKFAGMYPGREILSVEVD